MAKRRGWQRIRRIGGGLIVLLLVLGASGAFWNAWANQRARDTSPAPGQLYDVNGHAMHLYCTGQGSPVIVLESGHGENFTVWGKVQPALSRVTRTCAYDRAGFGWSETQPGPRDAEQIADQLHALLAKAGIDTPIVLMGHSAGGLYSRVYASRFPDGVAGLVLVDATSPSSLPKPPQLEALDQHSSLEFVLVKTMVALGIARAAGQCDTVPNGLEAYAGWIKANACILSQLNAYEQEDKDLGAARTQAAHTGPFGDLPILVLSQDPANRMPSFLAGHLSAADWHAWTVAHDAEQAAYIKLSTNSRRVIAAGSGHYVQYERPDVVNQEVISFIRSIRE
jgi:pimeloyl-ACP methyl ester carboxylesterase